MLFKRILPFCLLVVASSQAMESNGFLGQFKRMFNKSVLLGITASSVGASVEEHFSSALGKILKFSGMALFLKGGLEFVSPVQKESSKPSKKPSKTKNPWFDGGLS